MLTRDMLLNELDYDPNTGHFTWKRSGSGRKMGHKAGSKGKTGYITIGINRKNYMAHRLAWFYVNGTWPERCLDHINGIRDDNRIANLREAERWQNRANSTAQVNSSSKERCINWHKGNKQWRVCIRKQGKTVFYKHFKNLQDAIAARNEQFQLHLGDFNPLINRVEKE